MSSVYAQILIISCLDKANSFFVQFKALVIALNKLHSFSQAIQHGVPFTLQPNMIFLYHNHKIQAYTFA